MLCRRLAPLFRYCLVSSGAFLAGCSLLDPADDSEVLPVVAPVIVATPDSAPPDFGVRVLQPGSDVADLTVAHRHVLVPSRGGEGYRLAPASQRLDDFVLVAQGGHRSSSRAPAAAPPERDATFRAWEVYCNNGEGPGDEGMSTDQWELVGASTIPSELVAGCKPPK